MNDTSTTARTIFLLFPASFATIAVPQERLTHPRSLSRRRNSLAATGKPNLEAREDIKITDKAPIVRERERPAPPQFNLLPPNVRQDEKAARSRPICV
jgi:hypothetical protein